MSDRKSDSKGLPECVGEYVRQLLKKMRYRRKVRNDVEAELTAHFEDELKDCKSGEEKEQKVRKLLSDFGDLIVILVKIIFQITLPVVGVPDLDMVTNTDQRQGRS